MAIFGAFWLTLRIVAVGWFWTAEPLREPRESLWLRTAHVVGAGVMLNLLGIVLLASLGLYRPAWDWGLWGLCVLAGAWLAPSRRLPYGLFAGVWVVTLLAFIRPLPSEWLAGGWDPGLYQNNAVVLERDGHLRGRAESIYSLMPEEDLQLFTRSSGAYHEVFPGVPLRLEDGALPLYFFHLSPLCGAWFLRMGGPAFLHRMPSILALWGLLPLMGLFGWMEWTRWRRWLGLGAWLLAPMWWFQQSIPTSEMLYLFLLICGALFYILAAQRRARVPWGALGALFLMTVNHLNAAILLGGMLLLVSFAEGAEARRGRMCRLAACFAALALGVAWDVRYAGMTVLRLEEQDQALRVILPSFGLCAVLSLLAAWRPFPPVLRRSALALLRVGGVAAGGLLMGVAGLSAWGGGREAVVWVADRVPHAGAALWWLMRLVPFHGVWGCLLAGAGMIWLSLWRGPTQRGVRLLLVVFGAVWVLLLFRPGIAVLFPWALRRFMVFAVPVLVWAETAALVRFAEVSHGFRPPWRWVGMGLLCLPLLVEAVRLGGAACRAGDYPGLTTVLSALEASLQPGDVVVADDPEWGTPLLLAGGYEVLSGRRLWRSSDAEFQQRYLNALQRLRERTHRRFLWLTSLPDALGIYPVEIGVQGEPLLEVPYAFHTVKHDRRAREYAVKPRWRIFRLYEWDGTFRLPVADDAGGR
jgi:hypothetical protein